MLVYSEGCASHHYYLILEHLHHLQKKPGPIVVPQPLSPSPWQRPCRCELACFERIIQTESYNLWVTSFTKQYLPGLYSSVSLSRSHLEKMGQRQCWEREDPPPQNVSKVCREAMCCPLVAKRRTSAISATMGTGFWADSASLSPPWTYPSPCRAFGTTKLLESHPELLPLCLHL